MTTNSKEVEKEMQSKEAKKRFKPSLPLVLTGERVPTFLSGFLTIQPDRFKEDRQKQVR